MFRRAESPDATEPSGGKHRVFDPDTGAYFTPPQSHGLTHRQRLAILLTVAKLLGLSSEARNLFDTPTTFTGKSADHLHFSEVQVTNCKLRRQLNTSFERYSVTETLCWPNHYGIGRYSILLRFFVSLFHISYYYYSTYVVQYENWVFTPT